jgi:hypothetical protein
MAHIERVLAATIGLALPLGTALAAPADTPAAAHPATTTTAHPAAIQRADDDTSPKAARRIAKKMVARRGWSTKQYRCLVKLWQRESGWRVHAGGPLGSYGIPQAHPGSRMASAGRNWRDDATTQIRWGLGYIKGRYETPCRAWRHFQRQNWY